MEGGSTGGKRESLRAPRQPLSVRHLPFGHLGEVDEITWWVEGRSGQEVAAKLAMAAEAARERAGRSGVTFDHGKSQAILREAHPHGNGYSRSHSTRRPLLVGLGSGWIRNSPSGTTKGVMLKREKHHEHATAAGGPNGTDIGCLPKSNGGLRTVGSNVWGGTVVARGREARDGRWDRRTSEARQPGSFGRKTWGTLGMESASPGATRPGRLWERHRPSESD